MTLTYEAVVNYLQIAFDILVCWLVLNYIIKVVRTNQRTIQLFQGVIFIVLIQTISKLLGLTTLEWLANNVISWGFLALIIIFQPEIRGLLEKIGKSNAFARISTLSSSEKSKLIDELLIAVSNLASSKTGALITLEQSNSLNDYINTGIKINSNVSAELICSIFQTTTPLHDGAIIIQGDKLACASAYFPPTSLDLPSKYGARHRAAIGISEITDSVTIVVSEETGRVCVAEDGRLIQMNEKKLREYLDKVILNKESLKAESSKRVSSASASVEALLKRNASKQTTENELEKDSNREMKVFQTQTFTTSDFEDAEREYNFRTDRLVDEVINKAVSDNTIDENIVVKTVSTSNVASSTNTVTPVQQENVETPLENTRETETIKTTSVTTGTDKIFSIEDDEDEKEDGVNE